MATNRWRGDAPAVAQVVTITVTADDATTTYKVTINGKVVSILGSGSGVNTTASNLQVALAASTIAEFLEVTWTVASAVITGTAVTAGVPFTATSGVSGGTGTIGAVTTTTTNSGPNDINVAANWTLNAVPVNGNDVVITNTASSLLYNLGALSAVTANSIVIDASFTGQVGLSDINASGGYYEYRATQLQLGLQGAFTLTIGQGSGGGSPMIRLDLAATKMFGTVYSTGSSSQAGLEALTIRNTAANSTLNVWQGQVAFCAQSGDTGTLANLRIGYEQSQASDATVRVGSGATLTTIDQNGGVLNLYCAATTFTKKSGTSTVIGSGAISVHTVQGGTTYWMSSGTLTTCNVLENGTFDLTRDMQAHVVSNCNLYAGSSFLDSYKTLQASFVANLVKCSLAQITLDLGTDIVLTRT